MTFNFKREFVEGVLYDENPQHLLKLLEDGMGLNYYDHKSDKTLLMKIAHRQFLSIEAQIETALILLRKGANVNCVDDYGNILLHYASNCSQAALMRIFLEWCNNTHIDAQNRTGQTPLHSSCLYGHLENVQLLVEAGANTTILDGGGLTPLNMAKICSDSLDGQRRRKGCDVVDFLTIEVPLREKNCRAAVRTFLIIRRFRAKGILAEIDFNVTTYIARLIWETRRKPEWGILG